MKKKILIGSMLVLTLLLLMPSIPAVQQKSIEEGIKQELQEKFETINLDYLEGMEDFEWIRHPILYAIVMSFAYLQNFRFALNFMLSVSCTEPDGFGSFIFTKPILFAFFMFRAVWLSITAFTWVGFWTYISEVMEWDWNLPGVGWD